MEPLPTRVQGGPGRATHGANQATIQASVATVDQPDIRGSGTLPANMVLIRRELPLTCIADSGNSLTAKARTRILRTGSSSIAACFVPCHW